MKVYLRDNTVQELPEGMTARELAIQLQLTGPEQAVGVAINGENRDLCTPLQDGDSVTFFDFEDSEGKEVFWHTGAHLLAQAVQRLWPEAKPTIGPPIEQGFYYDFANLSISDSDFSRIEKEVKTILKENLLPEREEFVSKEEALQAFQHNPYKCELIEGFPEGEPLSAYRQGDFFDLCRGPHLPQLNKIKGFKILKTSGAYWRGDAENEMLTRIYGIAMPDRQMLKEYLQQLEEAKKRDHRVIGQKLDLFSLQEEAPGMPFIHPKGVVIWNGLLTYMRETLDKLDYVEIKTPTMMSRELWVRSGHWENYRDQMFVSQVEEKDFVLKPMNCPGGMLYYKTHAHSYRELPLRISEVGNVYRDELSGAISGLFRVRSFHQDDAHIFMEPHAIEPVILETLELFDEVYSMFGLEYSLELSTRPESHTIGSDEDWERATSGLQGALDKSGRDYRINEGDGAFYGPKIDFHIRDAIGRTWQCGTIQLDMALPERFELEYTNSEGERKRPAMIHRAIFGSIERFFGILIEHFGGRFPLWLSPTQVRMIGVADRHLSYCLEWQKKFKEAGLICEVDKTQESVSKKVRNAQLAQANYILTVGDRELENKTVSVRTRDNVVHGAVDPAEFLAVVLKEKRERKLKPAYTNSRE